MDLPLDPCVGETSRTVSSDLSLLSWALCRKRFALAHQIAGRLFADGVDSRSVLLRTVGLFVKFDAADQLARSFWLHRDLLFQHLGLIGSCMQSCGLERWERTFAPALEARFRADDGHKVRFSENDHLNRFAKQRGILRPLARLKWHGLPDVARESAAHVMDRETDRYRPSPALADFFFAESRFQHVGRERWDAAVGAASMLDHLLTDFRHLDGYDHQTTSLPFLYGPMSPDRLTGPLFEKMAGDAPLLVAVTHGPFLAAAVELYTHHLETGVIVLPRNATDSAQVIEAGRPEAAMLMLRAVEDGRNVMIAADGPLRRRAVEVEIFGVPYAVATGPAFVAYEADISTVFYSVARAGDHLVPTVVDGPRKRPGETLFGFTQRWAEAYAAEAKLGLTGPPESLALKGSLVGQLSRKLSAAEPGRSPAKPSRPPVRPSA